MKSFKGFIRKTELLMFFKRSGSATITRLIVNKIMIKKIMSMTKFYSIFIGKTK